MGACASSQSPSSSLGVVVVNPAMAKLRHKSLAQLEGAFEGRLECSIKETSLITCLVSLDGGRFVARGGSDKLIRIYRRRDVSGTATAAAAAVAPSCSDSKTDGGVAEQPLWMMDSERAGHTDIIKVLAVLPTNVRGSWALASAGLDTTVMIWASGTDEPVVLEGHTSTITQLLVVHAGSASSSCSSSSSASFADGAHGAVRLLSASRDCTVRVWSRAAEAAGAPLTQPQWGCVHVLASLASGPTLAVAIVPLGARWGAVAGSDDGSMRLWDLDAGAALATVDSAHADRVKSIATLQGLIASCSSDKSLKLWRAFDAAGGSESPAAAETTGGRAWKEGGEEEGSMGKSDTPPPLRTEKKYSLVLEQTLSGHMEPVTNLIPLRLLNDSSDGGADVEGGKGVEEPNGAGGGTELNGSTGLLSLSTDKFAKVWCTLSAANVRRLRARGRDPGLVGCAATMVGHTRAPSAAVPLRCGLVATASHFIDPVKGL